MFSVLSGSLKFLNLNARAFYHFLTHLSTEIFITAFDVFDVVFPPDCSLFKEWKSAFKTIDRDVCVRLCESSTWSVVFTAHVG